MVCARERRKSDPGNVNRANAANLSTDRLSADFYSPRLLINISTEFSKELDRMLRN
jgi:hypothetical protein